MATFTTTTIVNPNAGFFEGSAFVPIVITAALGAYVFDYWFHYKWALDASPNILTYTTLAGFLLGVVLMYLFFTWISRATGSALLGWVIGVPLGIIVQGILLSVLYSFIPQPGVSPVKYTAKQAWGFFFPTFTFNFLLAWFIVSIIFMFLALGGRAARFKHFAGYI